jgi:hypothetical protein
LVRPVLRQTCPNTTTPHIFIDHNTPMVEPAKIPWSLGQIPVTAMTLGIGCLLVSMLCFAADFQPRLIWLACVVITAYTLFYSTVVTVKCAASHRGVLKGDLPRRLDRLDRLARQQRPSLNDLNGYRICYAMSPITCW